MKRWLIVPAAGVGRRFGGDVPKQYLRLAGKTIAEHTLERLLLLADVAAIVVAINPRDQYWARLPVAADPRIRTVAGGDERAESVHHALESLTGEAAADDWVLVHDLVRPCVCLADVEKLMAMVATDPVGGILAAPVRDTIKTVSSEDEQGARRILHTQSREHLWAAQTPQMFRYGLLCAALARAATAGITATDEAAAVEHLGHSARIVEGRADNIKITGPDDLTIAEAILRQQREAEQ